MARLLKISRGGQLSLPAAIRRRWDTNAVLVEDRGDHVLIRPGADDAIAGARGAFAGAVKGRPTGVEAIRKSRSEDTAAERARQKRGQHRSAKPT